MDEKKEKKEKKEKNKFDIIIIGAGIIGSMIARSLSGYELSILLIEKECDICSGASSSNSAIIHSGHDPKHGTLKAELNVMGNKMWDEISKNLAIPFKRTGSYVIAITDEEFDIIKKLYEQAILNSVPGLKILKKNEILYKEPKVNSQVKGALWTPSTGIIDPFIATLAVCENSIMNNVNLMLNTKFENFIMDNNKIIGINTNKGDFFSTWVINCAGLYSDEVMHKASIRPEFTIEPRRGEYLIFDSSKLELNTVLYPVPTDKGKGTLVSTTTHGNVMIGPNAEFINNKNSEETTQKGLEEIINNAKKIVPSLNIKDVIAQFAGLRSRGNNFNNDFIIEIPEKIKGFVNLGGIESPGLASAPAIADHVINLLIKNGEKLIKKKNWNPIRIPPINIKELSFKEREKAVKKNPKYGRIVCRCEEITEGEIIDAIHSIIPASTYDSIKRRTWLGTGRCQGSFDYPRVLEILSKELNIPITEITKNGPKSNFIFRKTKELLNE